MSHVKFARVKAGLGQAAVAIIAVTHHQRVLHAHYLLVHRVSNGVKAARDDQDASAAVSKFDAVQCNCVLKLRLAVNSVLPDFERREIIELHAGHLPGLAASANEKRVMIPPKSCEAAMGDIANECGIISAHGTRPGKPCSFAACCDVVAKL